jgi:hypothetical protein
MNNMYDEDKNIIVYGLVDKTKKNHNNTGIATSE